MPPALSLRRASLSKGAGRPKGAKGDKVLVANKRAELLDDLMAAFTMEQLQCAFKNPTSNPNPCPNRKLRNLQKERGFKGSNPPTTRDTF